MQILKNPITTDELKKIASQTFGDLIKAVVDIDKRLIAIDAELHSDLEALLLENGSQQNDLWGVNFYPDMEGGDFLEFDSMINMRPSQENFSRSVDDPKKQEAIKLIVKEWIK